MDETTTFWTTYLSLFLVTGDVDGARYLWKRMPISLKNNNAEIGALWNIGKCLLARDFVALKDTFSGTTWVHAQPFISDIRTAIERRQLREISQAYSVISVTALTEALMCPTTADAVAIAQGKGWDVREGGDLVRPRPLPADASDDSDSSSGQRSYAKDMEMLQNLSAYVAHFEKRPLKIDLSAATAAATTSSSSSASASTGVAGAAATKMS